MSTCSFNRLLRFVNKQLDEDGDIEVHGHLTRCDICRDTVRQLLRDGREHCLTIALTR